MKYTLIVQNAPYRSQASDSAWHFAEAVLRRGHEILQVFFYFDGVYHVLDQAEPPQDERDVIARWKSLSETHQVPLIVCSTAATRRGVQHAIREPFTAGSLLQLSEAVGKSDHVIPFGSRA